MKISLILATRGRDKEVEAFMQSLLSQTYRDFELIIIDQNRDGKIDDLVQRHKYLFDIKHVKVDFTGNARARDYGIALIEGRIVAFPDDDCAYENNVLQQVVSEFSRRKDLAILVAGSYEFSSSAFSVGVNSRKPQYFSRFRMLGVEFTQFFELSRLNRFQFHFDHEFGIGSKYSGAEGFELLYRLLRSGCRAFYNPNIRIYHANKDHYKLGSARMLMYSTGIGAYIRKFANQRDAFIIYYIFRKMMIAPLLKILLALLCFNPKRIAYSYYNLVGIWRGFLEYGRY
jgi:glycosyltransferase involved in cell wall biosynthesis